MFSSIKSGTIFGMKSFIVDVEVDFSTGLPCFVMVGSLGSEVKESAERVKIALKNIGINIPPVHIAVNLSPADIRKSGTGFDLPVALGILIAEEIISPELVKNTLALGELGLDGEVKRVNGVMPIVWEGTKHGIKRFMVPKENVSEASLIPNIKIAGVSNLMDVINCCQNEDAWTESNNCSEECDSGENKNNRLMPDFSDVAGQENLKRGSLIAVAGFHHMLIMGPPGTGKTMIARRIPSILPPLRTDERMDITAIYSIAGMLNADMPIVSERPFVAPHHTISPQGMAGGGSVPRPGAVSLAHKGVLFLDELPEFSRQSIDMLRQPLEEKSISISRAAGSFLYPADIMLVAAMNPCPCGYYPDNNKCNCTPMAIKGYQGHISGPILDRMDICLVASRVNISTLGDENPQDKSGFSSVDLRKKVIEARQLQAQRYAGLNITCNSELNVNQIKRFCALEPKEKALLEKLCDRMDISARAYHRIMKVARTIADIEGSEKITAEHLTEAVGYRPQLGI